MGSVNGELRVKLQDMTESVFENAKLNKVYFAGAVQILS